MSEVEFAGVKFKGGRMLGIILALSTLVGGAYGGFEVYKDYMDMKEVIKNYEPPDLSRLDVFAERTANLEDKLNTKISNMERLLQSEISYQYCPPIMQILQQFTLIRVVNSVRVLKVL